MLVTKIMNLFKGLSDIFSTKQSQKGGDHSQQFQNNSINFILNIGKDEKFHEVYQEMSKISREDFTIYAHEFAIERVNRLEQYLIPKISKNEDALAAFADPSFQIFLKNAQKTAARTEREADYDLLSELLVNRIKSGGERITRAAINRAIEIVDDVDEKALCGLTVEYVLREIHPTSGMCMDGIGESKKVFSKILKKLPQDNNWLGHLEILDCIVMFFWEGIKKEKISYPDLMDGYFCVGIEKNSESYNKAIEALNESNLTSENLIDHELLDGFVRLPVARRDYIKNIEPKRSSLINEQNPHLSPTPAEIETFEKIWGFYNTEEGNKKIVYDRFFEIWNKNDVLKEVYNWYCSMSVPFALTDVGRVLANANANRLCPNISKMFLHSHV